MPKGKTYADEVAAEKAAADAEVAAIMEGHDPTVTVPKGEEEPAASGTGDATASGTGDATASGTGDAVVPGTGNATALDPHAENHAEALRQERERRRLRDEEYDRLKAEHDQLKGQFGQAQEIWKNQAEEWLKAAEQERQAETPLEPEDPDVAAFYAKLDERVEQRLAQRMAPLETEYERSQHELMKLRTQSSALAARQQHADYADVTGWTGDLERPYNPEHPFIKALAADHRLINPQRAAQNFGEAMYEAGIWWRKQQPDALRIEREEWERAKEAEIKARVEAEYRAADGKLVEPPTDGSLVAMGGSGAKGNRPFNPDDYDPYTATPAQRQQYDAHMNEWLSGR